MRVVRHLIETNAVCSEQKVKSQIYANTTYAC